ncbi:unnamed protein product, partial [Rotaria magnacalcarata]
MHLLFVIRCAFILLLSFVSNNNASYSSSDTNYALHSTNGTIITAISKPFHETEATETSHEHVIKELPAKSHDNHHLHKISKRKAPSLFQRYAYGLIAVFIVSALSLVGVLALPILYKVSFKYVLSLFTAIATGTLLGDAMFHLIPF